MLEYFFIKLLKGDLLKKFYNFALETHLLVAFAHVMHYLQMSGLKHAIHTKIHHLNLQNILHILVKSD